MRAILIDPATRTIRETDEYDGDFRTINELIDANMFDCVRMGDDEDNTIFVDDEGMMNGKADDGIFKVCGPNPAFLAGKGLMLATDSDGDSVATNMPLSELNKRIVFMTPHEAYLEAKRLGI